MVHPVEDVSESASVGMLRFFVIFVMVTVIAFQLDLQRVFRFQMDSGRQVCHTPIKISGAENLNPI